MNQKQKNTPIAEKITQTWSLHGKQIKDEYAWLRDDNWPQKIKNKKIASYLNQENNYFTNFMKPYETLQNNVFEELKGRIQLTDQSTYVRKDNYYYYTRTEANQEYSIYCRKKHSTTAPEEILLDVNKLAHNKKFTSLGSFSTSPDHTLLAYSIDHTGDERFTIRIFNLTKQQHLKDTIPNTIGSIIWHEDQSGFFYTPTDENWRQLQVYFHKLGDGVNDKKIFEEKDQLYHISLSQSSSKTHVFIDVIGHDSNEMYFIDMADTTQTPRNIINRLDNVEYTCDYADGFLYVRTNCDAKNFAMVTGVIDKNYKPIMWTPLLEYDEDRYLEGFDLTKNYLLLQYKSNLSGLDEIEVISRHDSSSKRKIQFPDAAYEAVVYSTNYEDDDIRINYSSFAKPTTVFTYDFQSENLKTLKVQEIPNGLNSDEYTVKRVYAEHGAVKIPVSLFYRKNLFKQDGSNPLYLYGYGSYGHAVSPTFSNSAISLVNRGFVYAIAHIRGGDDLGKGWHDSAKFLNKKRTFQDFIVVTEALINHQYASAGNIIASGGSAGGLLIGNVINEKPELYKAVIAHVPFVDVLNTMLDETLPLTIGEFKEWGNPKNKEYFDYMLSYSPYENIKEQKYPHIFATAGLSDPRVGYWEAAKWIAKLRTKNTSDNKILFKTNMDFGHSGASGRFDYLKEVAEDLVFICYVFGITSSP